MCTSGAFPGNLSRDLMQQPCGIHMAGKRWCRGSDACMQKTLRAFDAALPDSGP